MAGLSVSPVVDVGLDVGRAVAEPRLRRSPLPVVAFAAIALAASSFRIVIAPGFEMYLGPLFYLLAFRYGGVRLALPIALLVMAPSWFWWGHVYSIVIAAAHVLFIWWLRRRRWSFSIQTLVFQLTGGVLATYLIMMIHYEAPIEITALAYARKILNDLTLAAVVDLGAALIWISPSRPIAFRTTVRVARLMEAATILIVVASALAMFVGDVRGFPRAFADFQRDIRQRVELSILASTSVIVPRMDIQPYEVALGVQQTERVELEDVRPH